MQNIETFVHCAYSYDIIIFSFLGSHDDVNCQMNNDQINEASFSVMSELQNE